jgi:hypothetical protein
MLVAAMQEGIETLAACHNHYAGLLLDALQA